MKRSAQLLALLVGVLLISSAVPMSTAASAAPATPSASAHVSATQACVNAEQLVENDKKSLARTKRALRRAHDKAMKRRLSKQLARKKKALETAKKQQATVCEGSPGPGPGTTPTLNHPPVFPSPTQYWDHSGWNWTAGCYISYSVAIRVLTPATDPDDDTLTYSWTATSGSIVGNGLEAIWYRLIESCQVVPGEVTITANDGKGGTAQFLFPSLPNPGGSPPF
ncbi:MAG: hypothetical protein WBM00_03165 [Solirubrobacterales bacterium]